MMIHSSATSSNLGLATGSRERTVPILIPFRSGTNSIKRERRGKERTK
jgi:hypothetical protein